MSFQTHRRLLFTEQVELVVLERKEVQFLSTQISRPGKSRVLSEMLDADLLSSQGSPLKEVETCTMTWVAGLGMEV